MIGVMDGGTANRAVVYLFLAASLLALIGEIVSVLLFDASMLSFATPIRILLPLILAYGVSRGSTAAYFSSVAVCAVVGLASFYGLIELSVRTPFGPLQYLAIVQESVSLLMSAAILVLLQFCEFDGPSL